MVFRFDHVWFGKIRAPFSRQPLSPKMQEVEPGEMMEIDVEGNDTTVATTSERGEVAVCPEVVGEIRHPGHVHQEIIDVLGILDESDIALVAVLLEDRPRFIHVEGAAENFRVCAEAQKCEGGNSAEYDLGIRPVLPVSFGFFVMRVVFVRKRKPDIHVGEIGHGLG